MSYRMNEPNARAIDLAPGWRPFRIAEIANESSVIRSFYLEPADGLPIDPVAAGQHLPIQLHIPDQADPVMRTYTISHAPIEQRYRISVRKLGLASSHLHDAMQVGDMIAAKPPAGDFVIDARQRHHAVLVAAGVGITPMLTMLGHLVAGQQDGKPMRPVTLFYAAHSIDQRAFDSELAELCALAGNRLTLVRILAQSDGAHPGVDYDECGFIGPELFRRYLGFDRHDFYLCGPPPFMQAVYTGLRDLGVADNFIHAEAFGPASLTRTSDAPPPPKPQPLPADGEEPVLFDPSATQAIWRPGAGTLLELAESAGLKPEFGCRAGACGACKTRLRAGAVAYVRQTSAAHGPDEILICSAVPAARGPDDEPLVLLLA